MITLSVIQARVNKQPKNENQQVEVDLGGQNQQKIVTDIWVSGV